MARGALFRRETPRRYDGGAAGESPSTMATGAGAGDSAALALALAFIEASRSPADAAHSALLFSFFAMTGFASSSRHEDRGGYS